MARPTHVNIASGTNGWDGRMDDNFDVVFDAPFPIHEHTGDETDLASTFPPGSFDRCSVMVDHTTLGWSLYISDGTTWQRVAVLAPTAVTALTNSTTGTANDTVVDAGATYSRATLNNNFSDLIAKINAIRQVLVDNGLIT